MTPRGIRNNNPGNIELGSPWQGLAPQQTDGRFAQFQTPEHGIRAMGKVLNTYQRKHGLTTPRQMIGRWAPAGENDVESYVSQVAKNSGLDPDAPVDLRRDGSKLVAAMIQHENGQQPFDGQTIQRGLQMALANGADVLQGGEASDQLQEVTDPSLLEMLDGMQEVSDPGLIQQLEQGTQPDPQDKIDVEHALSQLDQPPPDRGPINPTDLLATTPPGALFAALRRQLPEEAGQALDRFVKGSSFGFSDELTGFANAVVSGTSEESFEQERQRFTEAERSAQEGFADRNPILAPALEVAGGAVALGPAGGGLVNLAKGVAPKVVAGAVEGGIAGTVVGAGNADGEDIQQKAIEGGAGGMIVGAALTRAGVGFQRYLEKRALAKAAPDAATLKSLSSDLFQTASQSGIVYKPRSISQLVDDIGVQMAGEVIDRDIHPMASRVMKRLPELVNKPATLQQVERMRKLATDAAFEAKPGSADARLAGMIRESLDNFSLDQSNMVAANAGAELQAEARKLWSQFRKDELVQYQVEKAMRRASSTGSGGNVNNAIRQNIRAILDNKKLVRGFTAEEREAMEKVVSGGPIDGLLRLAGKLSPSGNGLMLALHSGAAVGSNGLSLLAAGAGAGAKALADGATTKRVLALSSIIRSGGKVPHGRISQLAPAERRALAMAVKGQLGEPVGEPVMDAVSSTLEQPPR